MSACPAPLPSAPTPLLTPLPFPPSCLLTTHSLLCSRTEGGSALGVDFSKQGGGGTAASGALSELLKGGPGASTAAGAASGEEAAALSSAMRRLGVSEGGAAVGPTSGLQYSDLAPLVGSYGTRLPGRGVTLATSFRDPHHIPLQPAIREEGEAGAAGVEENSDEEWAERAERGIGGRAKQGRGVVVVEGGSGAREGGAGEDSSDEEGGAGGGGRGLGGDEDEGVFGDLH